MANTERPILFSGPAVRGILDGRKTQTRRVIKPQPFSVQGELKTGGMWLFDFRTHAVCPHGVPGDKLWVRETAIIAPKFWSDGPEVTCKDNEGVARLVQYLATSPNRDAANDYKLKATPSIHMPRWASRLTLEIVKVRVERLQDISNQDILDEGVPHEITPKDKGMRWQWQHLWDSINGKKHPWASNPWVWVVEFRLLTLEG